MRPLGTQPNWRAAPKPQEASGDAAGPLTLRQLAHELNSLLDGSLRCLGLAEQAMLQGAGRGDPGGIDAAAGRLSAARHAMRQMAELLEEAMAGPASPAGMWTDRTPLGEAVRQVVAALQPQAAADGIQITTVIDALIAGLPVGPLSPLIMNGLRNAIQACASASRGRSAARAHAEMAMLADPDGSLLLRITDTGAGTSGAEGGGGSSKPGGHGIGLSVCRRVVAALGGSMKLGDRVDGRAGACLQVRIPLAALRALDQRVPGSSQRAARPRES